MIRHIRLAEDELFIAQMYKQGIESHDDVQVTLAKNGQEAIYIPTEQNLI